MILKETIDKIIEAARIEEVVGDFVSLKKRGANYIGVCPFHNEKTPSFSVSPVKGIYKCFGCGKAGNAVNFIMEHDKVSYPEALRVLAKKYHIEIEEKELSQDQIDAQNSRESLFLANTFAQKYYENIIHHTEVGQSIGYSYFVERGFSDEIIKKFQLGYATDSWSDFAEEAIKQGYSKDVLVQAGLINDKGDRIHDRFRSRVIFPIHTLSGRVVAFTARTLSSDKSIPKYVNSPETEIYHKRNVLYGIFFAKKAIIENDNCFLVEGNTDVISLFQAGIENVVASSGTSLTVEQIKLIRRYTKNITILYDGDAAGIKASFRGIDLILEEGMNVKVVLFPDGEDPDSYARKHSASEIATFINTNASDFVYYKTTVLKDETNGDPIKKANMIKDIVSTIALIPDAITASFYIKQCCQLMEVSEQMLVSEVAKIQREKIKGNAKKEVSIVNPVVDDFSIVDTPVQEAYKGATFYQEADIIRLLLNYGQQYIQFELLTENKKDIIDVTVAQAIVDELEGGTYFSDPQFQSIFTAYSNGIRNNEILTSDFFVHHHDASIVKLSIDMLHSNYDISPSWVEKHQIFSALESNSMAVLKRSVLESVHKLKSKVILQSIAQCREELRNASEEEQLIILKKIQDLMSIRNEIEQYYGRVIS